MIAPPAEVRRLVYLGSPYAAVPPLRALCEAGFEIPLVVSRADTRRSRRGSAEPSAVKAAAMELGLAVTDSVDDVLTVGADLGVVVAYGRLIRPHVLDQLALVNVHFSLLPRWRGAAPVERALLAGDERTGVCLMALEEALDTGPIYRMRATTIQPRETAAGLRERLVEIGSELLVEGLTEGLGRPTAQEGEATYADKIDPAELEIDWLAPARLIDRLVRVGGAWTTLDGRRLKIWATSAPESGDLGPGELVGGRVGTGDGVLELLEVQPEGRPRRDMKAFLAGARLGPSSRLGP